nr:transposase [Streptomyces formicae]
MTGWPLWRPRNGTGDFFDSTLFTVDWDQRRAVCPGGHTSVQWRGAQSHRVTPVTRVRFAARRCGPCDLRTSCTSSGTGRNLTLRPKTEHEILQQARTEQDTDHWRRRYGHRAGVEAPSPKASRHAACEDPATAASRRPGCNITSPAPPSTSPASWLTGRPLARTRVSPFAALRPTG